MRKFGLLLAGLMTVASLAGPASAVARPTPSGSIVAAGSVTASGGLPRAGATVFLYAWPSDFGGPRTLLASTTAGANGRFALRASRSALSALAAPGGYANLEADAGTSAWFFSVKAAGPGRPVFIRLIDNAGPGTCGPWMFSRFVQNAWAIVGQSYVLPNATHVTQTFVYRKGQASTLGVGISNTGASGSYRPDGTVTATATSSINFPAFGPGNVWYLTRFRIARFMRTCMGSQEFMVAPKGWAGGFQTRHPRTAPRTKACTRVPRGSRYTTGNESAVTWRTGLMVTAVRFNGQSHTGYDANARVVFKFGASHLVCGTTGPPARAQQLVVKR